MTIGKKQLYYTNKLNTFSEVFLFSIDLFYVYIYCRKCNAEFNKLQTVGHRVVFSKNDVKHTHLCQ